MQITSERAFPHSALTYQINGCFLQTYRELGYGFSEAVCRKALAIVLVESGFEVRVEHEIAVSFRGELIGTFRADIVVNDTVLIEVKATPILEPYATAQILNYLKAAGGGVGVLVNFGRTPQRKRYVSGDNPANSLPNLRRPQT
jgi:GxxExxY protein